MPANDLPNRLRLFISALGPTAIALGLQVVAFAITARGLGVDQFGLYTPLLALSAIGVEVVGLGGAELLVRAVARDKEKFSVYFGNLLSLLVFSFPFVFVAAMLAAVWPIQSHLGLGLIAMTISGEILVGRTASSLELMMVAHHHITRASWLRTSTAALRLVIAASYFLACNFHELTGWIYVAFLQCIATSSAYFITAAFLYGRPHFSRALMEVSSGIAFSINQTARSAQMSIDRIVLSHFATNEVLGVYGAASRILQLGLFPIQVITRILYPHFFVHGANGIAATRSFALRSLPMILLVGCLSAIAVAIGGLLAPLVLGEEFSKSTEVAIKLAPAMPLIAVQFPAADILSGAGRQHLRALIFAIAALLFGILLAIGAHFGRVDGLIVAFLVGHGVLAGTLWAVAFKCSDHNVDLI